MTTTAAPNHLREAFEKFHLDNPWVWETFQKYGKGLHERGRRRYSARTIIERIRWDVAMSTVSDDGFHIANAHSAFYARLWRDAYPEMADLFQYVKSAADEA